MFRITVFRIIVTEPDIRDLTFCVIKRCNVLHVNQIIGIRSLFGPYVAWMAN